MNANTKLLIDSFPLHPDEKILLEKYIEVNAGAGRDIALSAIERKPSNSLFDIGLKGSITEKQWDGDEKTFTYEFSGWFPLAVIHSINWTALAGMSDYPEMVMAGDWSGIRDSSHANIWEMLPVAAEQLIGGGK